VVYRGEILGEVEVRYKDFLIVRMGVFNLETQVGDDSIT
jgi:hypothetical protein